MKTLAVWFAICLINKYILLLGDKFMKLEYKRDQIKDGGKTIANIRRDKLCAGTGTTTLCNVKDDKVR